VTSIIITRLRRGVHDTLHKFPRLSPNDPSRFRRLSISPSPRTLRIRAFFKKTIMRRFEDWRANGKYVVRKSFSTVIRNHNMLAGEVDSPTLLSSLNRQVPRRSSRPTLTFCIPSGATDHTKNEPVRRLRFDDSTDHPTVNS